MIGYKGEVPPDARGIRETILTAIVTADRDQFARDIFGFPLGEMTPKILASLLSVIGDDREASKAEMEREIEKAAGAAREYMRAMEALQRNVIEGARVYEEVLRQESEEK